MRLQPFSSKKLRYASRISALVMYFIGLSDFPSWEGPRAALRDLLKRPRAARFAHFCFFLVRAAFPLPACPALSYLSPSPAAAPAALPSEAASALLVALALAAAAAAAAAEAELKDAGLKVLEALAAFAVSP